MSLPQDQWPAWEPPTCADCNHPSGDHGSASNTALNISRGRCSRCDCERFRDTFDDTEEGRMTEPSDLRQSSVGRLLGLSKLQARKQGR